MVHQQTDIDINIYNLSGHRVDGLALNNPTTHEYNEISWSTGSLLPGLYFAGEMVDVHADLGGINFQWAWSSGQLAGARQGS